MKYKLVILLKNGHNYHMHLTNSSESGAKDLLREILTRVVTANSGETIVTVGYNTFGFVASEFAAAWVVEDTD